MRVLPLLIAFAASVPTAARAQDDVGRVEAVAHGLKAADNVRDVAAVVALYAPDAVMMPPNESPVQGIAAIRPPHTELFRTHHPALRSLRPRPPARLARRGGRAATSATDRRNRTVFIGVRRAGDTP